MKLGKSELVGTMNNDGVGAGDVDAGFNYGGANQQVVTFVVKVGHDFLQFPLWHLTVGNRDSSLGDNLLEEFSSLINGFDFVMQIEHLAATQQFPQHRLLDQAVLLFPDKCFH